MGTDVPLTSNWLLEVVQVWGVGCSQLGAKLKFVKENTCCHPVVILIRKSNSKQ